MGTILKNGRRKARALGRQAQGLSFPRRLCAVLLCDRRYFSNRSPVAKHYEGLSVLNSCQHTRCVTSEIRQSYGCHVLPPICTPLYRHRYTSSILAFLVKVRVRRCPRRGDRGTLSIDIYSLVSANSPIHLGFAWSFCAYSSCYDALSSDRLYLVQRRYSDDGIAVLLSRIPASRIPHLTKPRNNPQAFLPGFL
jgi:hypothetical protein